MTSAALIMAAVLALTTGVASAGDDQRSSRNERSLREVRARAQRFGKPTANDQMGRFLSGETQRLLERARALPLGSYELHRVLEALDDLLDARGDLADAAGSNNDDDARGEKREDTARRLERVYFRVQQGDYFGRLSGDGHAAEYILCSRQLYQMARSAYDRGDYRRARKVASASSELVNVLENLAHAASPRTDPPVLK